jgi:hypothetical protein
MKRVKLKIAAIIQRLVINREGDPDDNADAGWGD